MQALVFEKANKMAWKQVDEPRLIENTDVIVQVEGFTFSRQDFRPYLGQDKSVQPGRIMGHEAVGIVLQIGNAVKNFKVNDRVVVNCMTRCGECKACLERHTCLRAGFILGVTVDGTHAEKVRVPFADYSMFRIDRGMKLEHALLLSDVLPTAYENVFKKTIVSEKTAVAVIGDGPIGMAIVLFARYFKAKSIVLFGHHFDKMTKAKHLGATDFVQTDQPFLYLNKFDLVVECVGGSDGESFELAEELLDDDATLISVGVFKAPVTLHLEQFWSHNVTIKTGILHNIETGEIIELIQSKQLLPDGIFSKTVESQDTLRAFDEVLTNRSLLKVAVKF